LCTRDEEIAPGADGTIKSYLGEVVLNGLRDQVRHHTRRRRNAGQECAAGSQVLEDRTCPQEMPLEAIEKAELRATLLAALEKLPEDDRMLVRLKYVEQRPWSEVAGELGLAETTARRRGLEALDRLLRHVE